MKSFRFLVLLVLDRSFLVSDLELMRGGLYSWLDFYKPLNVGT